MKSEIDEIGFLEACRRLDDALYNAWDTYKTPEVREAFRQVNEMIKYLEDYNRALIGDFADRLKD